MIRFWEMANAFLCVYLSLDKPLLHVVPRERGQIIVAYPEGLKTKQQWLTLVFKVYTLLYHYQRFKHQWAEKSFFIWASSAEIRKIYFARWHSNC